MALLFILVGMSARASLQARSRREFIKNRLLRLLVPFLVYMALFAVPTAAFCFSTGGGWADFENVPGSVLVIIMLSVGMGHAWFMLELYVISMVFLPFKRLEKNTKFTTACENINIRIIKGLSTR